jgi:hypothetical protein
LPSPAISGQLEGVKRIDAGTGAGGCKTQFQAGIAAVPEYGSNEQAGA